MFLKVFKEMSFGNVYEWHNTGDLSNWSSSGIYHEVKKDAGMRTRVNEDNDR